MQFSVIDRVIQEEGLYLKYMHIIVETYAKPERVASIYLCLPVTISQLSHYTNFNQIRPADALFL